MSDYPQSEPPKTVRVTGDPVQPPVSPPEPPAGPPEDPIGTAAQTPEQPKPSLIDQLATRKGITVLGVALGLLLVLAVVFAVLYFTNQKPSKSDFPPITSFTPPPSLDELAEKYPKYAELLKDPVLGSTYKDFLIEYETTGVDGAIELARKRGMFNKKGELMVTLVFNSPVSQAAQDQLLAEGIVINTVAGSQMDIGIPLDLIKSQLESEDPGAIFKDLTELRDIKQVRFPMILTPKEGAANPFLSPRAQMQLESLPGMNAPAWHQSGFKGEGMRVGVLDFGFDGYRQELGKELPPEDRFTVQSFIAGTAADESGTVHGTAVSEIIHAIAPEAYIVSAAYQTDTEFFAAVDWLVSQNVSIINHSGGGEFGPRDGTGDDADAITNLMNNNILWVNSSGNSADVHWRGEFYDSNNDGVHEFDNDGIIGLGFIPFNRTRILIQWDDWDTGLEDLNAIILDSKGEVVMSSKEIQDGTIPPLEGFIYQFPDEGPYFLVIGAAKLTRPVMIDVFFHSAVMDPSLAVPVTSLLSPADTEAALTVGAVNWKTNELTVYSSQGPTTDGRLKPDLTGPSETYSPAYQEDFTGTSNSSPQVAGAATLIRQAYPNLTAYEIKEYLIQNARDAGPPGPDPAYGAGLLWMGDPPVAGDPTPEPDVTFATPEPIYITPAPVDEPPVTAGGEKSNLITVLLVSLCCVTILIVLGAVLLVLALSRRKKGTPPAAYRQGPPPPPAPYRPAPPATPAAYRPAPPPPPASPPAYRPPAPQPPPPPAAPQATTQCKFCNAPLRPGATFCPQCGQKQ